MSRSEPVVMLVAAEASGDALGAALARALKRRLEGRLRLVGVGGARMREEGIDSPFPIDELAVLGLLEGVRAYPRVVARADQTAAFALDRQPDIAVLIDSWGFNLRVARRLRRAMPQLPLLKYVAPQVWASRSGRARTLARTVDGLLTLHVMDEPYFARHGLPVTFVGSALNAPRHDPGGGAVFRASIGAGPDDPVLVVLPGSRRAEVARLGRPFGDAVARLAASYPRLHTVVPVAQTVAAEVTDWAATLPGRVHLVEREADKSRALAGSTAALACSGTVTTEVALAGVPMIVGYRLGAASYLAIKVIATTRYACLLNIVAEAEIVPEFLQGRCTGARLARALATLLADPTAWAAQVERQNMAIDRMGRDRPGDPADRAADAVIDMLNNRAVETGSSNPSPLVGGGGAHARTTWEDEGSRCGS